MKYVPRSEWNDAHGQAELHSAREQLQRYAHDPRVSRSPQLTCVALVFCDWELKLAEAVDALAPDRPDTLGNGCTS